MNDENNNPLNNLIEIQNAIAREGIFFRKAVAEKLSELHWSCDLESPYSLQRYTSEKGASRAADIVATKRLPDRDRATVKLILECKKSYSAKNKWIFFKTKDAPIESWAIELPQQIENEYNFFKHFSNIKIPYCYDQIVLRHDNDKKGQMLKKENIRNDSTSIYQASSEVSHALFGVKSNFAELLDELDMKNCQFRDDIKYNFWFVPVVVTNADLMVSEFKPTEITLTEGNVENFKLTPVPWLVYEYPLPSYLQTRQSNKILIYNNIWNEPPYVRKLPIIFLNSKSIKDFFYHIVYESVAQNSLMIGETL